MPLTTSLKLRDALKASIAKVAAVQGKTAPALMVDVLQEAVDDALARQKLYADAEASYQETVRTNCVYRGADVRAFALARAAGVKPRRPRAQLLDASKTLKSAHD